MRYVFIIALFFTTLTAGLGAQDWAAVVKKYGPAVGKIEIMDQATVVGSGSGFLIDGRGRLLTNAHVVEEAAHNAERKVVITFPQSAEPKKQYIAKIEKIAVERDLDLALLRVEGAFPVFCGLAAEEEPALMSDILVIGFPLGKSFKATPGSIQAFQEIDGVGHMLDLSAAVDFGNSGGPVFNKAGQVVGIVTAKIYGFNFNLALPIRNAADFIAGEERLITITFTSVPSGARIFLNDIYRGETPVTVKLYRRDYRLLVEKDGYVSIEKTVSLKGDASPSAAFTLEPFSDKTKTQVTITSTPAGARVLVDNTEMGETPLTIDATRGSLLRLKLIMPWYKDFYTEVTLGNDAQQVLHYKLER